MSQGKYEIRCVKVAVAPLCSHIFDEGVTTVEIEDEGGGEFVRVRQENRQGIAIDPSEWLVLRDAINKMIGGCRGAEVIE